jgi:hypothetical protein
MSSILPTMTMSRKLESVFLYPAVFTLMYANRILRRTMRYTSIDISQFDSIVR